MSKEKRKPEENGIPSNILDAISYLSPEYLIRSESSPSYPIANFNISAKLDSSKKMKNKEKEYKIGNYLIKKTLGQGTFGKVKLGIYLPSGEKVAIKILEKDKIVEKDDKTRVKREFDMLAKLNNPNVILVAEIFESQNNYYSVMEYCEGGELFNYIVKYRRLDNDEAAFFYYQLINGLEYIHSLGIVHRDLKPENLLLTKEHLLKIIDFGLSNYFREGQKELLSTPCGSPCYASPEMVSGKKYNGFKIDVWSTGIILYAMLCGYLPFEDKDNDILFEKILECKLIFPKYIKKDAKDLMQKILVTEPEKRINIKEIKKHPFYLKGKEIFEQEFSICQAESDKEIEINNGKKFTDLEEIENFLSNRKNNEKENINTLNIENNNKEIKNKIDKISIGLDSEKENNFRLLNIEFGKNRNNIGNIINLNDENKPKKNSTKKDKKPIQNKFKNDKKSLYVKNKELPFKLDNQGEIKKKINLNENKFNIRIKSRENKENKKQIQTINNNKFKNYLIKKVYNINSPNFKNNANNNKNIIKKKNNCSDLSQNKHDKKNTNPELFNLNINKMFFNTIENERTTNKTKMHSNIKKFISKEKNNNKKKYISKEDSNNINNNRIKNKNNIKDINIHFKIENNQPKIKAKTEMKKENNINIPKIKSIKIDIINNNTNNFNYNEAYKKTEKSTKDNIYNFDNNTLTEINKSKKTISIIDNNNIEKNKYKNNKRTLDKNIIGKKTIESNSNKQKINIDNEISIGFLLKHNNINKSEQFTKQEKLRKINNNKITILDNNQELNETKFKELGIISQNNNNFKTIENVGNTKHKSKIFGIKKTNEEKKSFIHMKLNSINKNKNNNQRILKNFLALNKNQKFVKHLNKTSNDLNININTSIKNPFINDSNNLEAINNTINYNFSPYLIINNTLSINNLNKKYKNNRLVTTSIKRNKPLVNIRNTLGNLNIMDTGLFFSSIDKKNEIKNGRKGPVTLHSKIHSNRLSGLCSKYNNNSYYTNYNVIHEKINKSNFQSINIKENNLNSKKIFGYKASYNIKNHKTNEKQGKRHMKINSMKKEDKKMN